MRRWCTRREFSSASGRKVEIQLHQCRRASGPETVGIEKLVNAIAIHQHMTGESPRMMFLHYWGVGRTEDLARGLKSALEQTRS